MVKQLIHLLFFLLVLPFSSWAQHPFYYNINTENGLPSNEVYELLQDSFGYLWIGCDAGLFRYDGFEFKQYKNRKQKGRSLSFVRQDMDGNIWCQNFNGQILKVAGDSLKIMLDYTQQSGKNPSFCLDNQKRIWTAVEQHLFCHSLDGALIDSISLNEQGALTSLTFFEDNLYAYSNNQGILEYKITEKKFSTYHFPNKEKKKGSARFVQKNDKLYTYIPATTNDSYGFFYQVHTTNHSLEYLHKIPLTKIVNMLHIDHNGKTWVLGNFGAELHDNIKWMQDSSSSTFFSEHRLSDILLDREGNYWFSSLENGIFIIPSLKIQQYQNLATGGLSRLHKDAYGRIWMGNTKGRFFYLDREKVLHQIEQPSIGNIRSTRDFEEIGDSLLIHIGRPFLMNLKTLELSALPGGSKRDVAYFQQKLFEVDYTKLDYTNYSDKNKKPTILSPQSGWSLAKDPNNKRLWAALNDGVHYYENGQLQLFTLNNQPIASGILETGEDVLWIGSLSQGIYGIKDLKLAYHFSTKNGLASNEIKTLKAKGDWLFATAGNQLYRIHLPSQKIDFFSKNLGILAKDIEDIEIRDRTVYLATYKGLFSLPIQHSAENKVAPNIRIEQVQLGDSLIHYQNSIKLPYLHPRLLIDFSATAFRSRNNFQYEYRLLGLDSSWTKLDSKNSFVAFTALPTGHYTFEVLAINESGFKSPIVAKLKIHVAPPIWQRWWFFALLALGFVGFVLTINYFRWRILARRLSLEQKLSRSQLTALKAQMNPHFMYNALNSIQDLMLMQDMRNANRYLSKFSNLMRKILNASDYDEILLTEEVELLQLYLELEKLRFGNEFIYNIELDENIDPDQEMIASMIIQPFVENALKHGLLHKKGEKNLAISFQKENNHLKCSILDNGIGRKKAAEIQARSQRPQSFATTATAKRLEILNDHYKNKKIGLEIIDLYDTKNNALGTKVILQLPTNIQHS